MINKTLFFAALLFTFSFFFYKSSEACVVGPSLVPYFMEDYSIRIINPLPDGIEIKMSKSDGVEVIANTAYPVYILKESLEKDKIFSRENVIFPKGMEPMLGLVAKQELEYNASYDEWVSRHTFSETTLYDPYVYVNTSSLGFKYQNITSLDPMLELIDPKPEIKTIYVWVNSKTYRVEVIKTHTADPEYKTKVKDALKLDLERSLRNSQKDENIFKTLLRLIFQKYFPTKELINC